MEKKEELNKNINLIKDVKDVEEIEDFGYLLILDFEAQCVEGEKLKVQEIIEFPVIVYDLKNKLTTNLLFHQYIKPKEMPILTKFCTELTGITQDIVDNGIYLEDTLINFDEFLIKNKLDTEKFTFVTCGDWDLNICLRKEAKFKKINLKNYFKTWINIKRVFEDFRGLNRPFGMVEMLESLGLSLDGRHHSGIDDVRNITKIADELIKKGSVFKKKKYLSSYK